MTNPNTLRMKRRTFLQAAGLAGGSMFLPSLGRAQTAATPRRVIVVLAELGWNPGEFRMKPPGAPDELLLRSAYHPAYSSLPDELRWELSLKDTPLDQWSATLAPLYPVRDHVIALDGLGMLSIGADDLGDAHARGWIHSISGHPASRYLTSQRAIGGAPSIDARIARHLRAQDPDLTDLVSLRLQVDHWWSTGGTNGFHHWFHDYDDGGGVVRTPTMGDPRDLFSRLFPAGSIPGQTVSPVEAGQKNILDLLTDRYKATFPNLGREDQVKLTGHQQRLSDIQQRLEQLSNASCSAPGAPVRNNAASEPELYMASVDAFFDMIVASMSCGLTRTAAIYLTNSGAEARNAFYGSADLDFHEWYSHGTNPPKAWLGVDGANVTQAEYDKYVDAAPVIARKNRFHMERIADLAQRLASVPEGEGSMLDHTAIVLMDEISHGSHGHDQWPVVIIGGFGGKFRTGRYIRLPRTNPNPGINGMRYVGVPHSHVLVSLCQGMGLPLDHMGIDAVYGRPDSFGGAGQRISLSGPLAELA